MTIFQQHRTYRFGSTEGLTKDQMETLIGYFNMADQPAEGALSGRTQTLITDLPPMGRVVIKPYRRGGVLRHFNRRTFLGLGAPRSQREFKRLQYVRQIGVNAPQPVAFAAKGRFFYYAWLVTKELPAVQTLSAACLPPAGAVADAMAGTVEQINRLIRHRILHVDLHPGNVLLDEQNRVYIIDFDKARITGESTEQLARRYRRRWYRAVVKHGLPRELDEWIQREVR